MQMERILSHDIRLFISTNILNIQILSEPVRVQVMGNNIQINCERNNVAYRRGT